MSSVVIDLTGAAQETALETPWRVRVSRAELDRLAQLCAAAPLTQRLVAPEVDSRTPAARLGAQAPTEPVASAEEIDSRLVEIGLIVEGAVSGLGKGVVEVWQHAQTAIEVEMLLSLRSGLARIRSHQRRLGTHVVSLSTGDGLTFELSRVALGDWWRELTRVAVVDLPSLAGASGEPSAGEQLPDDIETPWELLLGTGEAIASQRSDLVQQMVLDSEVPTTVAGAPVDAARTAHLHQELGTAARGRLHAAILGRDEVDLPGAGVVEWVLFGDGWRAMTPVLRDGWRYVRIERREPTELGRDLATLAAEVLS